MNALEKKAPRMNDAFDKCPSDETP